MIGVGARRVDLAPIAEDGERDRRRCARSELRPEDRTGRKRRDKLSIPFSLLVTKEEDGQYLVSVPKLVSPPLSFYCYRLSELQKTAEQALLAADMGYPTFNPGFVDVYDVSQDCRHPVLDSSTPMGILGHESAFSPCLHLVPFTIRNCPPLVA